MTQLDPRDRHVLDTLRTHGADLAKATEALFYLYVPAAGDAELAAAELSSHGYACEVRSPVPGYTQWLCLATRQMPLTDATVPHARALFESLATRLQGDFDGWEAALTK